MPIRLNLCLYDLEKVSVGQAPASSAAKFRRLLASQIVAQAPDGLSGFQCLLLRLNLLLF
ncbi:hypothetical protein OAF42_02305 [Planctomicrobium sp.]|jgi:hypothetical protein|nr:hypothetical protein [bacterium]MDB4733254.1 hypothetical protein [Planctomicrobium sp.]